MALPHFQSELRLADIATIGGFKMQGAASEDFAGFNFGRADINGDGLSDLIVCSDGYDGGGLLAGGAFVIYGKASGMTPFVDFANLARTDGFVIQGEFAYDLASRSVSGAGDVNGDGIEDMFIGAFKNDEGAFDSGAAYIIYGKTELFDSALDLYDLPLDAGVKIVGEASEDYASFWVASAGDVNGDGRNDLIMGAPQNDANGSNAGAAYVIFGRDSDFPGKIDLLDLDPPTGFKISGASAYDQAGLAVGSAGDINGDGVADLLIGAPQSEVNGSGLGYVIFGRTDIGAIDLSLLTAEQGFVIRGETSGDMAGFNMAGAGDVNGDGLGDILIGATGQDDGGPNAGAAYVIFGDADGFAETLDLADLDGTSGFKLQGAGAGDETGVCVSTAGDVNGDGYADLLVGAQFSSISGTESGVAYLLFGKPGGFAPVIDLANLDPRDGVRIRGEGAGDTTGRALSAAGDMNGDGYDDIAVGSPWNGAAGFKAGAAYVIYGRPDNAAPTALDSRVSGTEDVNYVFGTSDFGFVDPDGDALKDIRIATLATRGMLMLHGQNGAADSPVAVGQVVSAADFAAGRLFFVGDANASGVGYASFTFFVQDDGGAVANGSDTSVAAATLTIDLAADTTDAEDVIYGTSGDDTLVASGERASLIGLAGDDTYVVSSETHLAIEAPGEGDDTVRTSVSYELAAGSAIEQLQAADPTGTGFLRLAGNEFDNVIRGNDGVNGLLGGGGSNVLEGLGGDDSYVVSTSDQVIEASGGGRDTVYALADYVLTAGAHVEVLLPYDRASTLAQNLSGNELDNIIQGSDGDNVIVGGGGRDTMYGLRGDDVFHVDSLDDLPVELFGEGFDTIVASVSYVMPQGMEFEILRTFDPAATVAIDLTGNKIPNIIIGNAGNNVIDGLGGGDDMQGLDGDDTYIVRRTNDRVAEAAGQGYDIVRTLVNYQLTPGSDVETLQAYAALDTTALRLTGNELANAIIGNAGDNVLDGLGGGDDMQGLGGNDTYIVREAGDRVHEAIGGGQDIVRTFGDYELSPDSEVEALQAYDPLDTVPLRLIGNKFATTIIGNAGANVLDGGAGGDVLRGLDGSDTYIIEDSQTHVVERAGEGYDTVYTRTSFALDAGSEVETLTVYDRSTTTAVDLTGNELSNLIYGNAGANILDGGGGADTLQGLGGDDTYYVDNAGDRIIETAGAGRDTVHVRSSYTLAADAEVEVLAADPAATTGLRLGGNAFDNLIYGGSGDDSILGGGGNDTLYGLGGNDSYLVRDARAVVIEKQDDGRDTVYVTVDYGLAEASQVEVLTVYDRSTTDAIDLYGNEFANTLYGNAGDNRLGGGLGGDMLYGLGGNDTFVFSTEPGSGNVDRLMDFASGVDRIELDRLVFGALNAGALDSAQFVIGTQARDADDRLVYDQATGTLLYDADGVGGDEAVQVALLTPQTILSATDFLIA